jgi:hypothetical protein
MNLVGFSIVVRRQYDTDTVDPRVRTIGPKTRGAWIIGTHLANRWVNLGRGSNFVLTVKFCNTLVVGSYLPGTGKKLANPESVSHDYRDKRRD